MDERLLTRPVDVERILSRDPQILRPSTRTRAPTGQVLKLSGLPVPPRRRVCLVGGDVEGELTQAPPTIILEKSSEDVIRRITVRCPCGRHAELLCEYD
jgi:hypothetical protein